jgi:WD40 repeat protein
MKAPSVELISTITLITINSFILQGQTPEILLPIGHSGAVRDACFSPDGKKLITASDDRSVKVWNVETGKLLFTLGGFNDFQVINTVRYSPDGKSFLTTDEYGAIRIRSAANGKMLLNPATYRTDGTDEFSGIQENNPEKYSPDGKLFFRADGPDLYCWEVLSGKLIRIFKGNSGRIESLDFSPEGQKLVSGYSDKTAKIWDIQSGKIVQVLEDSSGINDFSTAAFSPDGKKIITLSQNEFSMWDIQDGTHKSKFSLDCLYKPSYCRDGRKILLVGNLYYEKGKWLERSEVNLSLDEDIIEFNGPVAGIYDALTGKLSVQFIDSASMDKEYGRVGSEVPFYCTQFSPGEEYVITINDKCRIWDSKTGILKYTIEGEFNDYSKVWFSDDGSRMLLITNSSANLYEFPAGILLNTFAPPKFRMYNRIEGNRTIVPTTGINPNGKSFFILSPNNESVKIREFKDGSVKIDLKGNSTPVSAAEFSKDGKKVLVKSFYNSNTAKIWDLQNGRLVQSFEGPEWKNVQFNATNDLLYTIFNSDYSGSILGAWKIQNEECQSRVVLQTDSIASCHFSPDNSTLIAIDSNFDACMLDVKTGMQWYSLPGPVCDARYTPDSKEFATSSWFNFIPVREVASGKLLRTLNDWEAYGDGDTLQMILQDYETGEPVTTTVTPNIPFRQLSNPGKILALSNIKNIDLSAEGKTVINVSYNSFYTTVWDIRSGALINRFSGNNPAISPDGTRVLTFDMGEEYEVVSLWDCRTGELLFSVDSNMFHECSAKFSPDGKYIATIKRDSLKIWDAMQGTLKQTIYFSGTLFDIDWENSKVMIHDNSKLVFFNLETGKELYSLISIDSSDYLVLTPDNYYMGSRNAAGRLSWRVGDQLYSFEQFDLQYNRPDIVLERLGNKDTALIKLYHDAYVKRLKKSGFSELMFSSEWHTPEAEILNTKVLTTQPGSPDLDLEIRGTDSKYKLDRLNVWVNDVPVFGKNGMSLRGENTSRVVKNIRVKLSYGINKILVSFINEKGVESMKESAEFLSEPEIKSKSDLYLISLSVSKYKDERYSLRYAVKDGRDMAGLFSSLALNPNEYNTIHIDTLFDKQATKENFLRLRGELLNTRVDDQVILFVSGHGLLDENMDFYFGSYDINFESPEKKGIAFNDLENILDGIPARKKLLLMDACHSGEVDKDELNELVASAPTTTADFVFRGKIKAYGYKGMDVKTNPSGITLNNSFELMQELFAGLDKGTGTMIISAAAGNEYALESPMWNNGVFTYSIINGLKNKAADRNGDNSITISELKDYSIRLVQLLTEGQQKPTARRESIGYDWKIW